MKEIICHTTLLSQGEEKTLTFWDILLDDRWTNGDFLCPEELYSEIGNINYKLRAKQNYEFLLRAALLYPVRAIGDSFFTPKEEDSWEAFRTDCYIVGKYQELLREHNYFDSIVTALIRQAFQMPWKEDGIALLESMISRSRDYYLIDDNTRPILLYHGSDFCLNLLNYFIDSLADAFRKLHQSVVIFNGNAENAHSLTQYIGKHFKAIIGIQTPVFSIKMDDGQTFLHDLITAPKYNMVLDHPAWLKNELLHTPQDYSLLLHDRNYIAFCKKYYKNLTECIHLPPAGMLSNLPDIPMATREYDISFIGSYRDYRERLSILYSYDRLHRHIAAHYIKTLRQNPEYTGEEALRLALQHFHIQMDDDRFLELFYDMRQVYFCIFLYYREKVVEALLNAGLKLHVFSESWQKSPLINHPCLTCHKEMDALESLKVMQNSKISLNIMSWHKDGLTERIFNSMLCKSVVLSDNSTALQEQFKNGEELLLFSLSELTGLPMQIMSLLQDNERLQAIAENGYKKALSHHTWQQRALQLLDILDNEK